MSSLIFPTFLSAAPTPRSTRRPCAAGLRHFRLRLRYITRERFVRRWYRSSEQKLDGDDYQCAGSDPKRDRHRPASPRWIFRASLKRFLSLAKSFHEPRSAFDELRSLL